MTSGNGNLYLADDQFISPSQGLLEFPSVIRNVVGFVSEDDQSKYTIVVGTDSEQNNGLAEFVSVIVVHRVGKHGRYFWKRIKGVKTYDRHDRILKEVSFSLELAQRLIEELRLRLNSQLYDFEIHLDVGQNGPSRGLIHEVVGMVTGNGFTAKIKPESYAANKVADRHV